MFLILLAALTGSAIGTVPARAAAWPSWVPRPAAAACPAGETLLSPDSATTDSLGVVHLRYPGFPGLAAALPPRGFRAGGGSVALRSDLARGGLTTARAAQLARRPAVPQFCASGHLFAGFQHGREVVGAGPGPVTGVAAHEDGNWAGYSVDGGTGFNGVSGQWTVATSRSSSPQPSSDDTWVGVGGDAQDCGAHQACSLIQAGTEMRSRSGYQSWFEFLCSLPDGTACPTSSSVPIQYSSGYGVSFTAAGNVVRPGDVIVALVYWESASNACFVLDDTSRASGSLSGCIAAAVPYDNRSIEWIDEDAYSGFGLYLADFRQTDWRSQTSYSSATGQTVPISTFRASPKFTVVGNIAATGLNGSIVPPCGHPGLLAYPAALSPANGGSSVTRWCAAGPPV